MMNVSETMQEVQSSEQASSKEAKLASFTLSTSAPSKHRIPHVLPKSAEQACCRPRCPPKNLRERNQDSLERDVSW